MSKAIGRDNIYREITDKIIAELERGIVPWVQPWTSGKQLSPLGLPVNGLTRRSYSGINILLLWSALEERGFASPYWVTFKQCIAMGGSVRKGEKGTMVVYADTFVPKAEQAKASASGEDARRVGFLDCEGQGVDHRLAIDVETARELMDACHADRVFRVGAGREHASGCGRGRTL